MMDYAHTGDAVCADTKPLETIGAIADDAERAATYIAAFITRFRHGNMPSVAGANTTQLKPVPSGHHGQIERLRDAVFEIDKLARELGSIG